MNDLLHHPNWGRFGFPALLVALAVGGYYFGTMTAPTATSTKAQKDAVAEKALSVGNDNYAIGILTQLANSGDAKAAYQLGAVYVTGTAAPQNATLATTWLTKAAKAGNTDAERQLGQLYLNGQLVVQDFAKARTWLSKAANAGNITAVRLLGDMDAEGLGQKANLVSAYAWYEVAAFHGDAYAHAKRDKILTRLDPAQQRQGEQDARTRLGEIAAPTSAGTNTATVPVTVAKASPVGASASGVPAKG